MASPTIQQQLIDRIQHLSDEQIRALISVAEVMEPYPKDRPYDPENDLLVGMYSGSSDLSENAKQILEDEITSTSGWTQKDKPSERDSG